MNERPGWDEIFMGFAQSISRRSTCSRLSVGCVVVTPDHTRILALGYNGGPKGLFNECLSSEAGACGHCHAELNALIKLDYSSPPGKIMYVTVSPCHACAVAIINAGISEVVYLHEYRKTEGLDLLRSAGIAVRKMCECDMVVEERNPTC